MNPCIPSEQFWREQFPTQVLPVALPADRPRPPAASYLRDTARLALDASLAAALRAHAGQRGMAMPVLLLAAFKTVLFHYSGQDALVVGAAIPKPEGDSEAPPARLLPVQSRWSIHDDTRAHDLVDALTRQLRLSSAHAGYPLDDLQELAGAEDSVFGRRLFNTAFCCERANGTNRPVIDAGFWAACDLVVTAALEDELILTAEFDADQFDPLFGQRLLGHLRMILEGIASAPDAPLLELPLLTEAERKQILEDWNATAAAFPADATLPELIRIKAAETPDAIALSCAGREMTYRELVAQAARLASQLRERGIRPEARAGVCMDRSLAMVVALLGILEAGGAYVPLDPAHPKDRLDFMIADAGITLVLCDATGRTALGAATAPLLDVNLDSPSPPPVSAVSAPGGTSANLAYVIYTSGSTGRPKGVPIEHRALVNFLCSTQRYPGIEPGDRLLAITTLSFDVAGLELWLPLIAGACVIIGSRDLAFDSPGLIHVLESERITMMQATPAIWRLLVESGWQGNPRLRVFSGGEALAPDLARELLPRCAELWNLYGPTETTIYSTLARITETDPIHIGRPAGNTDAYILNARLQPAPAGVPGELFLGGEGLARGYINRPELAAEKFIAHPLRPGRRLYRTGDLARWRADGNIEYMGRLDHQIKIHGHRIEPGELESVLREHPGIDAAIVVAREDTPGDKRLVAYIECRGGVAPNLRELREHLRKRVPEYMLPAACVRLARLPLTANNKIDRNALPAPQIPEDFESVEHARPRNAIEDRLAQIWADVLRLPRVGIHDDFFELGGDSMLVIRTLARARDAGLSFTARQVFQHPTIAQLAASHAKQDPRGIGGPASVWTASGTDDTEVVPPANPSRSELRDIGPKVNERSTSSKRRLLEMKLRKRGQEAQGEGRATRSGDSSTIPDHATSTIQRAPRDRPLRASFAQEQMSLLDQMEPDRPVYNVAWLYRLRGPLDAAAFEAAFGEIIRRHETLRTSIDWSGAEAIQVIQPFAGFHIAVTDLSRLETDKGIAEMRRLALQHTYEPFDPEREVLLRARLFRLGSDDHALLIGQHHIATDAWSWANLWSELTALYDAFRQGKPSPLPPLAIRYADFAHWQRAQLDAGRLESLLRFWRAEVGGASAVQLPTDRRRPPQPSYAGATIGFLLPRELVRDLEACARREHATLFMIMLAAFNVLQHRLSGQDEFIVGTAVAGRAVPATEPLIGCFINMLALRADLRGEPTFRELLQRVRDRMLAAFEHEQLPIDRLVADRRVKDPRSGLVYETALVAHNTPPPIPRLADLAIETLPKPEALARLDLLVTMEPREAGMELLVEYRTDLFDESTVRRWMQHFEILLRAATTTPDERIGRLPLLSPAEREEMLVAWNATAEPMPPAASLHALFTAQAARTPDATAIVSAGGNLTYRELDAQSRRLAVRLRALGVGPEKIVGLCVDRSPQMIAGILGILRAGGAYLPLDPEMPATRVATILEDAQAFALVTRGHLEPDLPPFSGPVVRIDEDIPSSEIVPKLSNDGARPENLAYVIYTSGSTGAHKGVLIEHRSAVNCTLAASRKFTLGPGDRLLQFASISFDTSVEEIFTTLASGATLVLRTDEMPADARTFLEACGKLGITVLDLPTAYWHSLTREMAAERLPLPESIRLVIIGGERALPECLRLWRQAVGDSIPLINGYGPTEATVVVTFAELSTTDAASTDRDVPIGRPLANTRIHLLDAHRQPVPVGVKGELCIGGVQVARGYHRRPELTAEKFIADPFSPPGSGERLYRTGDLARYRPDGTIEFLGRIDHQVKIRGFRVEPGEIEAAFARHPQIKETVVTAREQSPGEHQLIAYFAPLAGCAPETAALRRHLAASLPDYMIPAAFVSVERLPLNTSGKVDLRALQKIARTESANNLRAFSAPRTETEQRLAHVWREVLGLDRVSIHDDFFELGGHSLVAMRMVSRLRREFEIELPLRSLFEAHTVARQAGIIEELQTLRRPARPAPVDVSFEEELI